MSIREKKIVRTIGKVFFVLYIVFIIYFLLLSDWYGRGYVSEEFRYNITLFKEIQRFWIYRQMLGPFAVFANLFGNVLIFVPFGFFLPMASKHRSIISALFYSLELSLCVEVFQLFAKVGSFDVDDLLLNTVGGVVGYFLFVICNTIRRKNDIKKARKTNSRG